MYNTYYFYQVNYPNLMDPMSRRGQGWPHQLGLHNDNNNNNNNNDSNNGVMTTISSRLLILLL